MTLDEREQEFYSALSERAEREDYTPIDQMSEIARGQSTTPEELDALIRDRDGSQASTGWVDTPGGSLRRSPIVDAIGRAATSDAPAIDDDPDVRGA